MQAMSFSVVFAMLSITDATRYLAAPGPPAMSPECTEQVSKLQDPKFTQKAEECEQKAGFTAKLVAALQKQDEAGAVAQAKKLFVKCAEFSDKCAAEAAPEMVMQTRLSGMAVSTKCTTEITKAQTDTQRMEGVDQCQKDKGIGDGMVAALGKGDMDSAIDFAQGGLEKCMKISEQCAFQLAPIVVMQLIATASQPAQENQVIVLVVQPVIEKPKSFLEMAKSMTSSIKGRSYKLRRSAASLQHA